MRKLISLLILLLAVTTTAIYPSTASASTPPALPCALAALLMPPVKTIPKVRALSATAIDCDVVSIGCAVGEDAVRNSCLNAGENTSDFFGGCQCRGVRYYYDCMGRYGCATRGWAVLGQAEQDGCFIQF